jgi:hypothetical protein
VNFHIILNGNVNKKETGDVSDDMIADQIDVLNEFYSPDFRFELNSTDRIHGTSWFVTASESVKEMEMKTALRKGTGATLK